MVRSADGISERYAPLRMRRHHSGRLREFLELKLAMPGSAGVFRAGQAVHAPASGTNRIIFAVGHLAGAIRRYQFMPGRAAETSTRMHGSRIALPLGAAFACAIAALTFVPRGIEAEALLTAQDDPVRLADHALDRSFNADVARREIEAALEANDADLAQSFLDLARDRNVTVDPALVGAGRGRQLGAADRGARRRQLRAGLHRRRAAGFRRPCRHRARRPVRVRRHPRCGARRLAHGGG